MYRCKITYIFRITAVTNVIYLYFSKFLAVKYASTMILNKNH